MKHLLLVSLVLLMSLLGLTGCGTTFHGVSPIYPKVGVFSYDAPPIVDSLQPTLRWKPSSEPAGASYDIIIYELIKLEFKRMPGKTVYYRKCLTKPEHKVDEPLKPKTEYLWSVRTRLDGSVSNWSRYDWRAFVVFGSTAMYNCFFSFKTPEQ